MSLHVEAATEGDIPAWLELAAEVGDLFGVDMAGDPEFHRTLKCNIARGTAFCVRVDNELAGAMLFRRGWINWLAVRKRFRHRGAGRALVTHAISVGENEVRVTTFGERHPHPEADGARGLYSAMGFELTHEAPKPAPDKTPREILVWRAQKSRPG
jgi:ribosomal protein S18 acetylase RimI-like enzyme